MKKLKDMPWTGFVVDIEATGPIPGDYSMYDIGCVVLTRELKTFRIKLCPIGIGWKREALDSVGKTFVEITEDPDNVTASHAMKFFRDFVEINTRPDTYPQFFSDNNGFDWMFCCWYFHHFLDENPFGHTSRNIADIFRGMENHMRSNFKKLRDTRHTHNPVDDAMGNAEALIKMIDRFGLKGLEI